MIQKRVTQLKEVVKFLTTLDSSKKNFYSGDTLMAGIAENYNN